ncbi:MAG: nitroreductase [Deltaproteobacteria bacterium]|nr:MAG: nitroreductase [Deltaproteobacteria bacterium]
MRNPTDVPVHPFVAERWSPRAFSSEIVPFEVVRRVLEAARWAPSAFNEQPWRFLVACSARAPESHARLVSLLSDWNQTWAAKAPVLMLIAASTRYRKNGKTNVTAHYDAGQAAAWLTVQAVAEGLEVHQMGGFSAERARDLGLPEDVEPIAMIAMGWPGDPDTLNEELRKSERRIRERLPFDLIVYGGEWGEVLK